MSDRRLVILVREVSGETVGDYHARWSDLREAVVAQGAHAWRFRSTVHPQRYVEFLEFPAGGDPRDDSGVVHALEALEAEVGGGSGATDWEGEV